MRKSVINCKLVLIAFGLLLFGGAAAAAQKLILFEEQNKFGYKDAGGNKKIPARFKIAGKFSKEGLAQVLDDQGWAFINRTGQIVVRTPFIFDNGADYFVEGLARLTGNGKIGFFDKTGKTIIEPQFDFAFPFRNGAAIVCLDCRKGEPDINGHSSLIGGRWGFIDRRGKIIVPLRYEAAEDFQNGVGRVRLNGKLLRVNKKGEILK